MDKKGFTLVELLTVITIIGVLAAVAVTGYIGTLRSATRSEAYSNLQNLRLLQEQFFAENGTYAGAPATIGTVAVQGLFPRFQPGAGGNYNYSIANVSVAGAGVALTVPVAVPYAGANTPLPNAPNPSPPCFIATATGLANTRVVGDVFAIDCMNNRNF